MGFRSPEGRVQVNDGKGGKHGKKEPACEWKKEPVTLRWSLPCNCVALMNFTLRLRILKSLLCENILSTSIVNFVILLVSTSSII